MRNFILTLSAFGWISCGLVIVGHSYIDTSPNIGYALLAALACFLTAHQTLLDRKRP